MQLLPSPAVFAIDLFAEQRLAQAGFEQLQNFLTGRQRVLDTHSLAPVHDQPGAPKVGQMPGQERLWKAENGLELADAERLLQKQVEDAEPVGLSKSLEETVERRHGVFCLYAYAHKVPELRHFCQLMATILEINWLAQF